MTGYLLRESDRAWFLYSDHTGDFQPIKSHLLKSHKLLDGDKITLSKEGRLISFEDKPVTKGFVRPRMRQFQTLTPVFPTKRFELSNIEASNSDKKALRLYDLFAPIGHGQRGLVVAPPKAGKTWLLTQLAHSVLTTSPTSHLFILLIDERPEEVTEFKKVLPTAKVFASTFDQKPTRHVMLSKMVLERAKRLVEQGEDVVIFLDSITRLARAHSLLAPKNARIGSGGVVHEGLIPVKQLFGAARATEEAGNLTVIGSCLVETGSKMDEVIFEEFKGTGNMEIRLLRDLADKRCYPSLDLLGSGTRRDELLFDAGTVRAMAKFRSVLAPLDPMKRWKLVDQLLNETTDNGELLLRVLQKTQSS